MSGLPWKRGLESITEGMMLLSVCLKRWHAPTPVWIAVLAFVKALKVLEYVSDFYENASGIVEIRIELEVWRLRRLSKILNTLQQVAIVAAFVGYRKEAYVGPQCVWLMPWFSVHIRQACKNWRSHMCLAICCAGVEHMENFRLRCEGNRR